MMIYDMALVRADGYFYSTKQLIKILNVQGMFVLDYIPFRPIWGHTFLLGHQNIIIKATDFKVYYCYAEKDAKIINEWRDKYDIKKRYDNRSESSS